MEIFTKESLLLWRNREAEGSGCRRVSVLRITHLAILTCIGLLATAQPGTAGDTGYAVSLTPHIDQSTGNFKVRIAGYRGLNAHVVRTPSGNPASGVTVNFYTTLGTLSTSSGTTNSNGDIGTALWGGWVPGTATTRATVTINNTQYSDVALVPVVAPNGESTRVSGTAPPRSLFTQNLTPSEVNFIGLSVTERDGGGNDQCYFNGSLRTPYKNLTGGTWPVYTNNSWGEDNLSWGDDDITYYRARGRAPCGTSITQHMDVVRPGYWLGNLYYTSNSSALILQIHATGVANTRDSVTDNIPYP